LRGRQVGTVKVFFEREATQGGFATGVGAGSAAANAMA
jgi:hypothetical protein